MLEVPIDTKVDAMPAAPDGGSLSRVSWLCRIRRTGAAPTRAISLLTPIAYEPRSGVEVRTTRAALLG